MTKVPINDQNFDRCRCPHCPVENGSGCAMSKLNSATESIQNEAKLYCALGKSDCTDLAVNERCQCPTCSVWAQYDLNSTFYCVNGAAKE